MENRQIIVTEPDASRLQSLVRRQDEAGHDQEHVEELSVELERALVVAPERMPADVVTMNSRVRVLDLTTGARQEFELVYPADANVSAHRVSVLAPLGIALLGYRAGDELEWRMPGGLRRIRLESVVAA